MDLVEPLHGDVVVALDEPPGDVLVERAGQDGVAGLGVGPGDELYRLVNNEAEEALERRISSHVLMLTNLATKLRLSVQSAVRRDDGRLDEKRPGAHRLLGGNVTRLGPRGA